MPNLVEKDNCCGCSACENICGVDAIKMLADNTGFNFPVIDPEKCVECGACEKACPGLKPATIGKRVFTPRAFIIQHKDEIIRSQSASGGAFSAIAQAIIKEGGVVFGGAMNVELKVVHKEAKDLEELGLLRSSKYVQSEIGNSYKKAKEYLKTGRLVCFSGTPCQINGLHKYLDKDYKNLYSIDFVCRSVPSPLIWDKYVKYKRGKGKHLNQVVFRDKLRGYSYCTLAWYMSQEAKDKKKST